MKEEGRIFPVRDLTIPFGVEYTGISYCDGNYSWSRTRSAVTVIEYIVEGTGTVIVDGKTYRAKKGDIYILHRGTNHKYYCGWEKPWTKVFFNVYGTTTEQLLNAYGLTDDVIIPSCPLEDDFRAFYDIAKDLDQTDASIFNKCALQFHKIVQGIHTNKFHPLYLESEAETIKRILDQNVFNPVKIEAISQKLYRSNDYVHKLFKKTYNITPYEYLLSRKIDVAKQMLKQTNKSIAAISIQLSFSSPNYFSSYFKARTGYSPLEYRNL